jgi:hypothetical protein
VQAARIRYCYIITFCWMFEPFCGTRAGARGGVPVRSRVAGRRKVAIEAKNGRLPLGQCRRDMTKSGRHSPTWIEAFFGVMPYVPPCGHAMRRV